MAFTYLDVAIDIPDADAASMPSRSEFWWTPMSNDLSFREQLERRAGSSVAGRASSSTHVDLRIEMALPFPHGIAFAKLIASAGLGLAQAHAILDRLVVDHIVTVVVDDRELPRLVDSLRALGLSVSVLQSAR